PALSRSLPALSALGPLAPLRKGRVGRGRDNSDDCYEREDEQNSTHVHLRVDQFVQRLRDLDVRSIPSMLRARLNGDVAPSVDVTVAVTEQTPSRPSGRST